MQVENALTPIFTVGISRFDVISTDINSTHPKKADQPRQRKMGSKPEAEMEPKGAGSLRKRKRKKQ